MTSIQTSGPTTASIENFESVFYDHNDVFIGQDILIHEDYLYVQSLNEGIRIYSLDNPASPVLLSVYPGEKPNVTYYQADVSVGRFGDRVIMSMAIDEGNALHNPEVPNGYTDFVDVTNRSNPKFLVRMDGPVHTNDIVAERKLWIPSNTWGSEAVRDDTDSNLIYFFPNPLNMPSGSHPSQRQLSLYDISPVLENPPRQPELISKNDPVALWSNSRFRKDEAVRGPYFNNHEVTVYTNFRDSGKDILFFIEGLGRLSDDQGNKLYGGVYVIDITNPKSPEVLEYFMDPRMNPDNLIDVGAIPSEGYSELYHEALVLDGTDDKIILIGDEDLATNVPEELYVNQSSIIAASLSKDMLTMKFISDFRPTHYQLGQSPMGAGAHHFTSVNKIVFLGCWGGGVRAISYKDPANPVEVGRYIPVGCNAWTAYAKHGYIYIGDGNKGLEVVKFNPYTSTDGIVAKIGSTIASPSGRTGSTMAHYNSALDSSLSGLILFAGRNGSGYLSDVWRWDGNSWTLLKANTGAVAAPTSRFLAVSQSFGTNKQGTLLFGGYGGATNDDLGDTYVWNGTAWQLVTLPTSPPPRLAAASAHDPVTGNVFMFGGRAFGTSNVLPASLTALLADAKLYTSDGGDSVHGDTWVWSATTQTWSDVTSGSEPSPRFGAAMAYDAKNKKFILFGGVDASGNRLNDTWSFNGSAWTEISVPSGQRPSARGYSMIAYNEKYNQVILHGGLGESGARLTDTYIWTGKSWKKARSSVKPDVVMGTMTFDPISRRVLLFGGDNSVADLYAWDGKEWDKIEPAF